MNTGNPDAVAALKEARRHARLAAAYLREAVTIAAIDASEAAENEARADLNRRRREAIDARDISRLRALI
jgi:hypothetical protein